MEAPGGTGKSAGEGEEAVSQRLGAQGRPGKSESVHPQGAASGFLNLTNLLGTLFAPWIFGVLLDSYGKGPKDGGYLAGYLWLALFPLFGSIAGAVYLATRRAARAPAPESQP